MRLLLLCVIAIIAVVSADYTASDVQKTSYGLSAQLDIIPGTEGPYGGDITPLLFQAYFETKDTVRIKISDPNNARWEVPFVVNTENKGNRDQDVDYDVTVTTSSFGFAIRRISTGEVLFNSTTTATSAPLTFEDQYIQLSTSVQEKDPNFYGLGERVHPFRLNNTMTYTLWTKDQGTPPDVNLYGFHPFYMQVKENGNTHGVFMLNSNAMDVVLENGQLQYRMIGGIIDLRVFVGPTPKDVSSQYTAVIGRPHMPPYWALGFHQCRWGYKTLGDVETVVEQYAKHNFPLDTIWTDIDYMDAYRCFTTDPVNYPSDQFAAFVDQLHKNGMHYIPITDPGIFIDDGYFAYNALINSSSYIKDVDGNPFHGKVWPGPVVYPDFSDPAAHKYWLEMLTGFHNLIAIDGLWIDMNEVSNFCDGECKPSSSSSTATAAIETDSNGRRLRFDPNTPPYIPGGKPMKEKTLDMDAQHLTTIEYNIHNMFGHTEGMATVEAMETIRNARSVVISRSTFAGSGSHNGHWLGDNYSTYESMAASIAGVLDMSIFGIPLIGADICGFSGNTTEELCTRWMEVGAFYPFSRNHNSIGQSSQEPYVFSEAAQNAMRNALNTRYTLVPYLYTLFMNAHNTGSLVAAPLLYNFPTDPNVWPIDLQFMWGEALLISPVLQQGATSVNAYFPAGTWYHYYNYSTIISTGEWVLLDAPLHVINVHIRSGYILPAQYPDLTLTAARRTPFNLIVGYDAKGASGEIYLDDGESLNVGDAYTSVTFTAATQKSSVVVISSTVNHAGYKPETDLVDLVTVYGLPFYPKSVSNGKAQIPFSYDANVQLLQISKANVPMTEAWTITIQ